MAVPRLKRVLTLWDLIFYGIVLITAIPLFDIAQQLSRGHFVTTANVVGGTALQRHPTPWIPNPAPIMIDFSETSGYDFCLREGTVGGPHAALVFTSRNRNLLV